jgi:hypothetical protein
LGSRAVSAATSIFKIKLKRSKVTLSGRYIELGPGSEPSMPQGFQLLELHVKALADRLHL